MTNASATSARSVGFSPLGDAIQALLTDHPKRDLIMRGFGEARRVIEADGVDAARRRLLAPDEAITLVCPRCHDAGWLRVDCASASADFGRIVECPCGVVARTRADMLFGSSRIPAEYADLDLGTFPDQRIAALVRQWWQDRSSPWILLVGDLGVGKTGLTIGLLKAVLAAGRTALFRSLVDLLADIRATYQTHDASTPAEADMMATLKRVDVLALDDVGAARMTGWAQERVFEILNHRYNERRATILTTNLGPSEMESYLGDRIVSRINGMAWIYEIEGPNLRERS